MTPYLRLLCTPEAAQKHLLRCQNTSPKRFQYYRGHPGDASRGQKTTDDSKGLPILPHPHPHKRRSKTPQRGFCSDCKEGIREKGMVLQREEENGEEGLRRDGRCWAGTWEKGSQEVKERQVLNGGPPTRLSWAGSKTSLKGYPKNSRRHPKSLQHQPLGKLGEDPGITGTGIIEV